MDNKKLPRIISFVKAGLRNLTGLIILIEQQQLGD